MSNLNLRNKIEEMMKQFPNDFELGREIRYLIYRLQKKENSKEANKETDQDEF